MGSQSHTEDEELPEYEVEDIVMHMPDPRGKGWIYLVKWKNYSSDRNTWEPEAHLTCPLILSRYKARIPNVFNRKRGKRSKNLVDEDAHVNSEDADGEDAIFDTGSESGKRTRREVSVEVSHSLRREISVPSRLILTSANATKRGRGRPRKIQRDTDTEYQLRSRSVADDRHKGSKRAEVPSTEMAPKPKIVSSKTVTTALGAQKRNNPPKPTKDLTSDVPYRTGIQSSADIPHMQPVISKNSRSSRRPAPRVGQATTSAEDEIEYLPAELYDEVFISEGAVDEYCECSCHK